MVSRDDRLMMLVGESAADARDIKGGDKWRVDERDEESGKGQEGRVSDAGKAAAG